MIGNTLSYSATDQVTLVRENDYSSEYRRRTATSEITVKIKHSVESQLTNGEKMDRHNVTMTRVDFPGIDNGVAYPARTYEVTLILRTPSLNDGAPILDTHTKLAYLLANGGVAAAIVGWQS